jgi:hypothetical protein
MRSSTTVTLSNGDSLPELRKICASSLRRSRGSFITRVVVQSWDERRDGGYGRTLGIALAKNMSVTSLRLCAHGLLGPLVDDTSDEVDPLLHYIARSETLTVLESPSGL